MKIAIMQPYLFPYIGYFQLMNAADKFVVYDDVTYIKSGWINRNRILVNNREHMFTIPLKNASSNILIKDIQISLNDKWINKLLKTLDQNYKKAPYFEEIFSLVSRIINIKTKYIRDMHLRSFQLINQYLGIETSVIETSNIYNNQYMKGKQRVIDICHQENAKHYINPIGGQELYEKELFMKNGIKLSFLKTEEINYPQFESDFVPWLSVIDVMMFNSLEIIQNMLNQYELI
ncbi:MAG: WbqC family protein [Bacteroidetes bacterium]|nr:WbqC family protein [Bacteroidota bacterium]